MSSVSGPVLLESRPAHIFAAYYDQLPFPHFAGPRQELVFTLGVTAVQAAVALEGVIVTLLRGHQVLAEQRWTASMLKAHTGQAQLSIAAGTGLAVPCLHFNAPGQTRADCVQARVVARAPDGRLGNATLAIPVTFPAQAADLHFPLAGAWWAIQGSDWTDQHKAEPVSQAFALDFVKLGAEAEFYAGDGSRLEDHYGWGAPVYAPAAARVAHVICDMPDLPPGAVPDPAQMQGDPRRLLGNAVALSHRQGEFSYLAHLQQASVQVRVGDHIRRGALVGYVGNSGHSPGPHLHYHLMNGPNLFLDQALPLRLSHFWAGGHYHATAQVIPSRLIVKGPAR